MFDYRLKVCDSGTWHVRLWDSEIPTQFQPLTEMQLKLYDEKKLVAIITSGTELAVVWWDAEDC